MPYYNGATTVVRALVIATGLGMLLLGGAQVRGMDNIEVMVCPAANQSSFSISQPQSDSIVNEPRLPVEGSVEYISQIDFFIDDTYNNTIALGYSETQFSSEISLSPGTHTIKFVATDSCSQTIHEDSVVVTYEPKTQSSVGENVDTVVDGRVAEGVVVPSIEPEKNIIEKAIDRFVVPPYHAVAKALDIGAPSEPDPVVQAGNVARSVLFVTGTILTLSAVHVGALSASVLPDKLSFLLPFRRRALAASALIGLALMVLVFIL